MCVAYSKLYQRTQGGVNEQSYWLDYHTVLIQSAFTCPKSPVKKSEQFMKLVHTLFF